MLIICQIKKVLLQTASKDFLPTQDLLMYLPTYSTTTIFLEEISNPYLSNEYILHPQW